MATKVIKVEPLDKRFVVELGDVSRERKNLSFANASDCHRKPLKQVKVCSECGAGEGTAHVAGKTQCKLLKLGKREIPIQTTVLDDALRQLQEIEEITITMVTDKEPEIAEEYYDNLLRVYDEEKHPAHLVELREVLRGKVAWGTAAFRNNEYAVMMYVRGDEVFLRRFSEEAQRYDFDRGEVAKRLEGVKVSPQVIEVERRILEKKCKASEEAAELLHRFKDLRTKLVEQIVEDAANGKEVLVMPSVQVAEQREQDELERLMALEAEL